MASYQSYQPLPFEFICILCKKQFTSPIVLDCFHIFDWPCLKRYFSGILNSSKERNLFCPICRKTTSLPPSGEIFHIPTDYALIKFLALRARLSHDQPNPSASKPEEENVQPLFCSTCDLSLNDPAVAHCVECAGFLCESSVASHRQILSLKSHHVVRFEQLGVPSPSGSLSAYSSSQSAQPAEGSESPELLDARAKLAEVAASINLPSLVSLTTPIEIVRRKVDEKFLDVEKQLYESLNEAMNEKLIGKEKERNTRVKNFKCLVQDLKTVIETVERLSVAEKEGQPPPPPEELEKLERVLKERGSQAREIAQLVDFQKSGADQADVIGQFTQALFGLSFQFDPDKFERELGKLLGTPSAPLPPVNTNPSASSTTSKR